MGRAHRVTDSSDAECRAAWSSVDQRRAEDDAARQERLTKRTERQNHNVTEATDVASTTAAEPSDVVVIRLPAAGAYLSVLRTATAGLAARLDFTLDEIEDLRIAVDEACAMLLTQAVPGADLECEFLLHDDTITVSVSVYTLDGQQPSRETFAWTVLSALAGEVDSAVDSESRVTIHLRKRRGGSTR